MMPAVRGPRIQPTTVELRCGNCGAVVVASTDSDRAHCRNCANVWNWKAKTLIRGQRGKA